MESFIAGFAYGATTVLVGQPLDTIKTLQQTSSKATEGLAKNVGTSNRASMIEISKQLYQTGGVSAFYRGGTALLVGGGLIRSAQFGVYKSALQSIRQRYGQTTPDGRWLGGAVDPQVVVAGFCGGVGRGMVEGPFEMIKVRRQVLGTWGFREILKGAGTTLVRNSFLFGSFAIYMDVSDHLLPLTPFWKGGICANLAWLTVWPLDVVKSRMQSGAYDGKSMLSVLYECSKSGDLYRGLVPGLTRSFIANGSSMVVYNYVEKELKRKWNIV